MSQNGGTDETGNRTSRSSRVQGRFSKTDRKGPSGRNQFPDLRGIHGHHRTAPTGGGKVISGRLRRLRNGAAGGLHSLTRQHVRGSLLHVFKDDTGAPGTSTLTSSFASLDPALQESFSNAQLASRIGDYARAVAELKYLAGSPQLTAEQRQIVQKMLAEAEKGLSEATKNSTGQPGKK